MIEVLSDFSVPQRYSIIPGATDKARLQIRSILLHLDISTNSSFISLNYLDATDNIVK
jgi:hypothetical protein